MHRRTPLALLAAFALALPGSLQADVVREYTGQLRADLDKLEMQAFPADAWGKLASWTGGEALTAAKTDGKPILIATWASWHPGSLKAVPLVQRLADKFGGQGLIVVGVHHKEGWAEAAQVAKDRGLKFLMAHDAQGEFRKALQAKHEPMFFLVDRAGRMRYAGAASASLDEACTELVGETTAQANDLPAILKKRAEEAAAQGRMTTEIRPELDLASLPAVPPGYATPGEAAYKAAVWPKLGESAKDYGMVDASGNKVEAKLAFTPHGFQPARPETQGRAIVLYMWHPDMPSSYSTVMPQMDLLQQQYSRDLAVIGAVVPIRSIDPQRANSQHEEPVEGLMKKYQNMAKSRSFRHALAADVASSALGSLSQGGFSGSSRFPVPGAMIVSTDGVIRWVGRTDGPDFKYAIDTVLAADPGIKARRAADRAFIENRRK